MPPHGRAAKARRGQQQPPQAAGRRGPVPPPDTWRPGSHAAGGPPSAPASGLAWPSGLPTPAAAARAGATPLGGRPGAAPASGSGCAEAAAHAAALEQLRGSVAALLRARGPQAPCAPAAEAGHARPMYVVLRQGQDAWTPHHAAAEACRADPRAGWQAAWLHEHWGGHREGQRSGWPDAARGGDVVASSGCTAVERSQCRSLDPEPPSSGSISTGSTRASDEAAPSSDSSADRTQATSPRRRSKGKPRGQGSDVPERSRGERSDASGTGSAKSGLEGRSSGSPADGPQPVGGDASEGPGQSGEGAGSVGRGAERLLALEFGSIGAQLQMLEEEEDPRRVLVARRCHTLGFQSEQLLTEHCSEFGRVSRVLVMHSRVKHKNMPRTPLRVRPGSIGFIVMAEAEGAERALREGGPAQTVAGRRIELGPFQRPPPGPTPPGSGAGPARAAVDDDGGAVGGAVGGTVGGDGGAVGAGGGEAASGSGSQG